MKLKVYLADDEPLIRMDMKEMLKEYGYEIVGEAGDGIDVLKDYKECQPDIIILDVKMPLLNGIKTAELLRKEEYNGCIIMLTAYSDKEFIDETNKYGVMGYFIKPLDERVFIPNLEILYTRSKDFIKLKKDREKAEDKLEERKVIEKAKGLIMDSQSKNESEAYNYLRNISMEKRIPMRKIAELVIATEGSIC